MEPQITIKNNRIIPIWTIPFVTIDVKKPTSEPTPVFNDCSHDDFVTKSSASTAPKNGPINIPANGMTNGPINNPIVLPHMPAFEPPNFFTPTKFDTVSAPNSKTTNKISMTQNHQGKSLKL